jgi:hypothetical protein
VHGVGIGQMSKRWCKTLLDSQRTNPQSRLTVNGQTHWQFQERFYWENDGLDAGQVYALLVTRQQWEQKGIDRAQVMVAMGALRIQLP